jgi:hypothetical protein
MVTVPSSMDNKQGVVMNSRSSISVAAVCLGVALLSSNAFAVDVVFWNGTTGADFNDPANWQVGGDVSTRGQVSPTNNAVRPSYHFNAQMTDDLTIGNWECWNWVGNPTYTLDFNGYTLRSLNDSFFRNTTTTVFKNGTFQGRGNDDNIRAMRADTSNSTLILDNMQIEAFLSMHGGHGNVQVIVTNGTQVIGGIDLHHYIGNTMIVTGPDTFIDQGNRQLCVGGWQGTDEIADNRLFLRDGANILATGQICVGYRAHDCYFEVNNATLTSNGRWCFIGGTAAAYNNKVRFCNGAHVRMEGFEVNSTGCSNTLEVCDGALFETDGNTWRSDGALRFGTNGKDGLFWVHDGGIVSNHYNDFVHFQIGQNNGANSNRLMITDGGYFYNRSDTWVGAQWGNMTTGNVLHVSSGGTFYNASRLHFGPYGVGSRIEIDPDGLIVASEFNGYIFGSGNVMAISNGTLRILANGQFYSTSPDNANSTLGGVTSIFRGDHPRLETTNRNMLFYVAPTIRFEVPAGGYTAAPIVSGANIHLAHKFNGALCYPNLEFDIEQYSRKGGGIVPLFSAPNGVLYGTAEDGNNLALPGDAALLAHFESQIPDGCRLLVDTRTISLKVPNRNGTTILLR